MHLRISRKCKESVRGCQYLGGSENIVITDAFAKVLGDAMGTRKYERAVLGTYTVNGLKTYLSIYDIRVYRRFGGMRWAHRSMSGQF